VGNLLVINGNLGNARIAKNDEFYTQYSDIEKEMNGYLEFDPDVFRDKTLLLPCDDPEWSNFTKYFAQNFEKLGLKKLISTSYAPDSRLVNMMGQPTLFESESPQFDVEKTRANGKIFTLFRDKTGDSRIDVNDLEWEYLEGDGDFRSEEISRLRDEADVVITNPPFSLFREFLAWIVEAGKQFVIIGNMNAITYKEAFPLIQKNQMWLGRSIHSGDREFEVPRDLETRSKSLRVDESGKRFIRVDGVRWFTNLDHGLRHKPLSLMTEADNKKFSKHKEVKGVGYMAYDNYDAIEVPFTDAIPSDFPGVMGVPISFLSKYNPDQFEIVGNGQSMADELGIRPVGQEFVDAYYEQGNKGQISAKWNNLVYRIGEKVVVPYQRILIRHRNPAK
jgi:hypothetical protein